MKILQVVPYFYPAWAYGGPAKLVYDTSLYFAQQGHEVTVYTSDAYNAEKRMPFNKKIKNTPKLKVYYFRNIFNALTYKYNIFSCPELFFTSFWQVNRFDIIHLHDFYTPHNLWLALCARIFSKPYILSVHGCLETARVAQRSLFKRLFLTFGGQLLLRHASLLIASSDNEAAAYLEYGVDKSRIVMLGHGVNKEEFETKLTKIQARKKLNIPSSSLVFTFVGRIHRIKGLDLLIKSFTKLKQPNSHLVIAGSDDGYLSTLKELIATSKVKNIKVLGTCFGEEKAQLFKASDVFVYPSYSEGFSLGILEAASVGLPLVITTGCHFDEVQGSKSGFVVKPTPEALCKALEKVATSPALRKEFSHNVKQLIQSKYSMEAIGNKLLDLYKKASSTI